MWRLEGVITVTMLKVVFVLGCLLSFALAHPTDMEHKRLARSRSGSHSNERIYRPPMVNFPFAPPAWPPMVNIPSATTIPPWVQSLLALIQQTTAPK
ncbi:hypothetical protein PFLUV_G00009730 [Perca fluviatilis]|uniref:Uncharacterized protein n=1 Tax=Perca fluviatilis TaxID=8168 RepID=A0A6A5FQT3_PERFL|nr:hypothetical protein PFLUV_G00009730 [Perca fluviatilis]